MELGCVHLSLAVMYLKFGRFSGHVREVEGLQVARRVAKDRRAWDSWESAFVGDDRNGGVE